MRSAARKGEGSSERVEADYEAGNVLEGSVSGVRWVMRNPRSSTLDWKGVKRRGGGDRLAITVLGKDGKDGKNVFGPCLMVVLYSLYID